ncbi:MAG: hypothetical protein JRJ02_15890 [Deltaproteobacteria bacterium]|nr:hypothetical protein [Deltaproteobacteria bacterium]
MISDYENVGAAAIPAAPLGTKIVKIKNLFIVHAETLIPFASTPSQHLKNLSVGAAGTP